MALPITEYGNKVCKLNVIILKFYWRLGSSFAQFPVLFQDDQIIVKPNLECSRFRVIR